VTIEEPKRSEKHEAARNSLPDELKPIFHDRLADYRFAPTKHHGSPFVSYVVLAELVRTGSGLGNQPIVRDDRITGD